MAEIVKEITSSPEKLNAAVEIKNAVDQAIEQLRIKLNDAVMSKAGVSGTIDYDYKAI